MQEKDKRRILKKSNFAGIILILFALAFTSYYVVNMLADYYQRFEILNAESVTSLTHVEKDNEKSSIRDKIFENVAGKMKMILDKGEESLLSAKQIINSNENKSLLADDEVHRDDSNSTLKEQLVVSELIVNFLLEKDFTEALFRVKKIKLPEELNNIIKDFEEYNKTQASSEAARLKVFPVKYKFFEKMFKVEKKTDTQQHKDKLKNQIIAKLNKFSDYLYSSIHQTEFNPK